MELRDTNIQEKKEFTKRLIALMSSLKAKLKKFQVVVLKLENLIAESKDMQIKNYTDIKINDLIQILKSQKFNGKIDEDCKSHKLSIYGLKEGTTINIDNLSKEGNSKILNGQFRTSLSDNPNHSIPIISKMVHVFDYKNTANSQTQGKNNVASSQKPYEAICESKEEILMDKNDIYSEESSETEYKHFYEKLLSFKKQTNQIVENMNPGDFDIRKNTALLPENDHFHNMLLFLLQLLSEINDKNFLFSDYNCGPKQTREPIREIDDIKMEE
ncbi:hypothetical protein EDEG_00464 [Edhazardia aedis USNM 41457]|uniref:Uncharacterized protein n=1 Tax=Edhazardia aedis (strain USNM 41457) TaxID=1003232 RepID=J9D1A3_EDHAE|nr:hypothetical protein EDEG_00464 [Edhazardia aedis USNM 41457]|eukprot:EJW01359.1 hypothetical protein EDEG_00464 [Edhazardia aedis USNM 41457]